MAAHAHAEDLRTLELRINVHDTTLAVHDEQRKEDRSDIDQLASLMKWVIVSLVGFAFTVAGSAVTVALSAGGL